MAELEYVLQEFGGRVRAGEDATTGAAGATEVWIVIRKREDQLQGLLGQLRNAVDGGAPWKLAGTWRFGRVSVMRVDFERL
jgi:hypothetical protein